MATVVRPAAVVGDEAHGVVLLNEIRVLVNEFCMAR